MYNIFKYLPLIYINHNRHTIENHISNLFVKKKLHFIPYIVNVIIGSHREHNVRGDVKFNYFLDTYYKKIKESIK